MSFSSLKKKSGKKFITELLEKTNADNSSNTNYEDDRFWKLKRDKQGNGFAIIRFLPGNGENIPEFVKMYSHAFTGPGGWYIENSRTTINDADPVSDYNSRLWNTGIESNRNIARNQRRKLTYYSNIYVIKDPACPENEGKVFIFGYGKSIFEKLVAAMNPVTYGDGDNYVSDDPINPFDLWEGANFRLKAKKSDGYIKYIDSSFDQPKPLFNDDKKLEEVYNQQYDISELVDEKNFKSYDELKKRLDKVLSFDTAIGNNSEQNIKKAKPKAEQIDVSNEDDNLSNDIPFDVDEDDVTNNIDEDEELSEDILSKLSNMVDD